MSEKKPLVLDVDGTFLRTDLLFESFWRGLGRDPIATLKAAWQHRRDKPALKAALAQIAELRLDLMPVNSQVQALAAAAQDFHSCHAEPVTNRRMERDNGIVATIRVDEI